VHKQTAETTHASASSLTFLDGKRSLGAARWILASYAYSFCFLTSADWQTQTASQRDVVSLDHRIFKRSKKRLARQVATISTVRTA
jgi:hypothetical protein